MIKTSQNIGLKLLGSNPMNLPFRVCLGCFLGKSRDITHFYTKYGEVNKILSCFTCMWLAITQPPTEIAFPCCIQRTDWSFSLSLSISSAYSSFGTLSNVVASCAYGAALNNSAAHTNKNDPHRARTSAECVEAWQSTSLAFQRLSCLF